MPPTTISIDRLIEIVNQGGIVKTGIDVYDKRGLLLLEKDVLIKKVEILQAVKKTGVKQVPFIEGGGIWDSEGRRMPLLSQAPPTSDLAPPTTFDPAVEKKVQQIEEIKKLATVTYQRAKDDFKKTVQEIIRSGGYFDIEEVRATVDNLFQFLSANETAFSYLTKEILSYDDYLYNHSINVCTIGTAILNKFNENFSAVINESLSNNPHGQVAGNSGDHSASFVNYLPEDLRDVSLGYFLHDVGKLLIPEKILNKNGPLTDSEFAIIKGHSFEKGSEIFAKNHINNPFAKNPALYHHCPLYEGEARCYPGDKRPIEVPIYVKFCKLADIYDAMTSKRAYKEAMNPTGVVTNIYRQYADRDRTLQFILHSFVKAVGIYPPGSIITMCNGQLAYVMDSVGPIALPFTDTDGRTLKKNEHPINLGEMEKIDPSLGVDRRQPLISPIAIHDLLPPFLKKSLQ